MSVDEVNAILPTLAEVFKRLEALREELAARSNEIERLGFGAAPNQPEAPPEIVQRRQIIATRVREYQNEIERIGELGGTLKDLDLGFVDFAAQLDGEPVLLTWQYGETEIRHYRPQGAEQSGRRALPTNDKAL